MKSTGGFQSFWMGGFEGATHINRFGHRQDMIAGIQHDQFAFEDYQMMMGAGLKVARDALRWHLIDRRGKLDFTSFIPMLTAATRAGIQVIWSLQHYGFPDDLDIFSEEYLERFERFTEATAKLIREHSDDVPYFTPVNEISFYSWAGSRNFMYPFAEGKDNQLKNQLLRAAILASNVLRRIDPRCRLVHVDPIIHVVAPPARPDLIEEAVALHNAQFDAWDILAGRKSPELGGNPELLDIVGMNFYHSNQWEVNGERIAWHAVPRDTRWQPLSQMMKVVWDRYHRPLFLSETSHVGEGRADWITEVAEETSLALRQGIPIEGICLFPIIDRYDWENPQHWHNSGLWDLEVLNGTYKRVLNLPYCAALERARKILPL